MPLAVVGVGDRYRHRFTGIGARDVNNLLGNVAHRLTIVPSSEERLGDLGTINMNNSCPAFLDPRGSGTVG